jgi:hypothetical protein
MSYRPYRTPEMARRQRVYEWLCVAALGLMIVCVFAIAVLVVMLLGG